MSLRHSVSVTAIVTCGDGTSSIPNVTIMAAGCLTARSAKPLARSPDTLTIWEPVSGFEPDLPLTRSMLPSLVSATCTDATRECCRRTQNQGISRRSVP